MSGGSFEDSATAAAAGYNAAVNNDLKSILAGKGASSQINSILKETNMNPSGRRIVSGVAGGTIGGVVTGCAVGSAAGGLGCLPGAVIGAVLGSGGGFVTSGTIEILQLGQPIEDVMGISLGTTTGYIDYNIRKITQ